jgi:hypothetical protein
MATSISNMLEQHAASLGARGRVDLARVALKFGKKLNLATADDDHELRELSRSIFGLNF